MNHKDPLGIEAITHPESRSEIADVIASARHEIMMAIAGINGTRETKLDPKSHYERYARGMKRLTDLESTLRLPKRRLRVVAGRES